MEMDKDNKLHFLRNDATKLPGLLSQPDQNDPSQHIGDSDAQQRFHCCRPNDSFVPVWQHDGFSHCFYNTIVCSLLALLLIPVQRQIALMKRNAVIVESKYQPKSFRYKLQLVCVFLLILEAPTYFGVKYGVIFHRTSVISVITCTVRFATLSASLWLLTLERARMLLTSRVEGHSNILICLWGFVCASEVAAVVSWNSAHWWWLQTSYGDKIETDFWAIRLAASSLLTILTFSSPGVPQLHHWLHSNMDPDRDVENGLVSGSESETQYLQAGGSTQTATGSTWKGLKSKLRLLGPYLWPSTSLTLQLRVVVCVLLLVAGRVVNPYVPIFSKNIVNSLTASDPWSKLVFEVLIYVLLRLLQGGGTSGLLNGARQWLWIRVQQYTNRTVQIKLFAHLHSLSLRWHLSRKTGEVLRSIDRGTNSINNVLSYVVFSILPTICDIVIAIVYFITAFNAWFGLIVFVCLALYLVATVVITEWRTKFRREMNTRDNKAKQRAIDSLLNFETVKYYNAESYEVGKFENFILDYQESEYKTSSSLVLLNMSQSVIINLGLLAGSLLCANMVLGDSLKVGDYVLFGTYIIQLYTPLNYFGTYYRMIQSSFIDMENMLDLFHEAEEVVDVEGATVLPLTEGRVEFRNVCFHYKPEKAILKDVSFTVEPGQTFALVGPSGMGKSTIIRLLLRFYDLQSGSILIDGHDVSTVTQQSLRAGIGVVPQDTVLFNDDIMSNIRYGRSTASDEDVVSAARAADIHDRIEAMPDRYLTAVGERGLKLSGGEKQRVAIARTLLKSPDIVLLDEATSALDTTTERNIQASLARVCAGRTSIVVAHRLSTIVGVDCILVLNDGEIVERGSHDELLELDGFYARMWHEQLVDNKTSGDQLKRD